MKNQKMERSLLFKSLREDFRASTDKTSFHRTLSKIRTDFSDSSGEEDSSKALPFEFLADFGLEHLFPYLNIRHVQAGEVIWQQGDSCSFMVFVDRGKIKITKRTEFDTNQVVVGLIGKGSLTGDFSMFEGNRFPTTATALEYSLLGILDLERFHEILEKSPDLGVLLLKEMLSSTSLQLRQSLNRLVHLF